KRVVQTSSPSSSYFQRGLLLSIRCQLATWRIRPCLQVANFQRDSPCTPKSTGHSEGIGGGGPKKPIIQTRRPSAPTSPKSIPSRIFLPSGPILAQVNRSRP